MITHAQCAVLESANRHRVAATTRKARNEKAHAGWRIGNPGPHEFSLKKFGLEEM